MNMRVLFLVGVPQYSRGGDVFRTPLLPILIDVSLQTLILIGRALQAALFPSYFSLCFAGLDHLFVVVNGAPMMLQQSLLKMV